MAKSTVAVRFTGDVAALKKSVGDVEGRLGKLGSSAASVGKKMAIGLAAGAVGAVALGKSFVDAAYESQKIGKQTEAVIKSMGGASKITADQVGELSEKLSLQSGVDDELIQSSQNVLLTFGRVRNEVGKGNKIFDRAAQSVLDMSVALGTDMTQSATMVGKALNDPIQGLSAMRRVGIQFTEQQQEQIKTMVKVGDVAGAQKVMLAELERQFGGSAAAQATAADRLKVAWGNVQEELGAKLIPVVERAATWLADVLPGAMDTAGAVAQRVGAWFGEHLPPLIETGRLAFQSIADWVQEHWPEIQATIETAGAAVEAVLNGIIEAGQFVIEHWDQFQFVAAAVALAVAAHYASLGVAATASAATQATAWVSMKLAAAASKAETAAIIALMIADWAKLAARSVIHAAKVVASWVATSVAGAASSAATVASVTVSQGAWAGLAVAAETSSARVAKAWLGVLGPAGLVIAAAEKINNLTGNKLNPNNLNLLERLDPRKAFKGLNFDLPGFAGGVRNFRGGLAVVGEEGPELVKLPRGSDVFSNRESAHMSARGPIFHIDNMNVAETVDFELLMQRAAVSGAFG